MCTWEIPRENEALIELLLRVHVQLKTKERKMWETNIEEAPRTSTVNKSKILYTDLNSYCPSVRVSCDLATFLFFFFFNVKNISALLTS